MDENNDADIVRKYLRVVIGRPVQRGYDQEELERQFAEAASRWAESKLVDRRTLATLGVPTSVLETAGVKPETVADHVRARYRRRPFGASYLIRESQVSASSVRKTLAEDEASGIVRRAGNSGRVQLWQLQEQA